MNLRRRAAGPRTPSREGPATRVHVCMKQPCNYCLARRNAVFPEATGDGERADFIDAVVTELRRRSTVAAAGRLPRGKSRSR